MMRPDLDGLLFDKDGTLFDFRATWDVWAAAELRRFARGKSELLERLAHSLDFDLETEQFKPESLVIAGTNREVAEAIAPHLNAEPGAIELELMMSAATAPLAPAVPLGPLLDRLKSHGLRLGVMTNDSEYAAVTHLQSAGVKDRFDFVAGSDSGHGGKPAPEPLLAFATAMGINPARVAMVGDSLHDLIAGRAAGMITVAVLTGTAVAEDLAPLADVVLPDIGAIPEWLGLS